MVWLLIAIIAIVVFFALIFLVKHQPGKIRLPYEKRNALFTPGEKLFLEALEKAVGGQYKIFGKIRMEDIMEVKKNLSESNRQGARNRIKSRHIDFVLCNATDASFVCGIELDDKSHNQASRVKRDGFVDEAFKTISLPLIRFEQKRGYDTEKIQNQIMQGLEVGGRDESRPYK